VYQAKFVGPIEFVITQFDCILKNMKIKKNKQCNPNKIPLSLIA
jgi:hypothetical protein